MSGPSSDTVRKHLAAERQLPELPPGTHARILSRVRATAATPPASLVASASGLGTKLVLLVGGVVSAVAVAIMIGNAGGEIVSVPAPTPTATPAPTPTPTSALPERVLLDRAQSALAANDPASALAATREHSKHYPHGTLSEERDVLRIRALLAAGDERAASMAADTFWRRFPRSIHGPGVDALSPPR